MSKTHQIGISASRYRSKYHYLMCELAKFILHVPGREGLREIGITYFNIHKAKKCLIYVTENKENFTEVVRKESGVTMTEQEKKKAC